MKSTTNTILLLLTVSSIIFLGVNMYLSAKGIEIKLNEILTGFFGSLLGYIIGAKGGKSAAGQIVNNNKNTAIEELKKVKDTFVSKEIKKAPKEKKINIEDLV